MIEPIVVKCVLYKHNLTDRTLINKLKKSASIDSDMTYHINSMSLHKIIKSNYHDDLTISYCQDTQKTYDEASSAVFIDSIINGNPTVTHFQFLISKTEQYKRVPNKDDTMAMFSGSVMYARLKMWTLPIELKEGMLTVFKEIGLYDHSAPSYTTNPYFFTQISTIIDKVNDLPMSSNLRVIADNFVNYLPPKIKADDPVILVIAQD